MADGDAATGRGPRRRGRQRRKAWAAMSARRPARTQGWRRTDHTSTAAVGPAASSSSSRRGGSVRSASRAPPLSVHTARATPAQRPRPGGGEAQSGANAARPSSTVASAVGYRSAAWAPPPFPSSRPRRSYTFAREKKSRCCCARSSVCCRCRCCFCVSSILSPALPFSTLRAASSASPGSGRGNARCSSSHWRTACSTSACRCSCHHDAAYGFESARTVSSPPPKSRTRTACVATRGRRKWRLDSRLARSW